MAEAVKGLTASPADRGIYRPPLGIHPDGEIGPLCAHTGKLLRWGEAMVVEATYVCWEAYLELTGAEPATEGIEVYNPYKDSGMAREYMPVSED